MVKHGTYTLDAPPPFQGVWRATVDRVHYRLHYVRMYLLGAGDCHEIYLRHLPDDEYAFARCYYHRGAYDGFCPFASSVYTFDDQRMHATRLPSIYEELPTPLVREMKPKAAFKIGGWESKPESLIIPHSASPEPMSTMDMRQPTVIVEPVTTDSSLTSIDTDQVSSPYVHDHELEPDTAPKSPFSDLPIPRNTDDDIDPFPFPYYTPVTATPASPSVYSTRGHTPSDPFVQPLTGFMPLSHAQVHVPSGPMPSPSPQPEEILDLLHTTSGNAAALAGSVAALRASLLSLETQLFSAREHYHALETTVNQQDDTIAGLKKELEGERSKVYKLRAEKGRLLAHRACMFEAFGLDDPEKWDADE